MDAVSAAHSFLRRRGWSVFKVQRPLLSSAADPPWLFTEEGGKRRAFGIPASLVPPDLRALMGDRLKRLVLARPVAGEDGVRLKVRGVTPQEALRFRAGAA